MAISGVYSPTFVILKVYILIGGSMKVLLDCRINRELQHPHKYGDTEMYEEIMNQVNFTNI